MIVLDITILNVRLSLCTRNIIRTITSIIVCDATHEFVAKFVYEEVVLHFGCPTEIITDRKNNFITVTLNSYLKMIGVKHVLLQLIILAPTGLLSVLIVYLVLCWHSFH